MLEGIFFYLDKLKKCFSETGFPGRICFGSVWKRSFRGEIDQFLTKNRVFGKK